MSESNIESLLSYWFEPEPEPEPEPKPESEPKPAPAPAPEPEPKPAGRERQCKLFKRWFSSTPDQDRELAQRFGGLARDAAEGRLADWKRTARGRLALILLLDQLPRNLHRGEAAAFAQDSKAFELCTDGIEAGLDNDLGQIERGFFYMPLQHAESREAQARSVAVFGALASEPVPDHVRAALENFAHYAELHRDIIERFGRFPHRNQALRRSSTDEERGYLASGGPSFGQ